MTIIYLLIADVYARFFLDIEMNAKRVIDDNLKLASEVHVTKELIDHDQIVEVRMNNGYRLETQAEFLTNTEDTSVIGPSSQLKIKSRVLDKSGKFVGAKEFFEVIINLKEMKEMDIATDDLQFTIKITPYLK